MKSRLPFRINYPINLLDTSTSINFANKKMRTNILKRSIYYDVYDKKKNSLLQSQWRKYIFLAKHAKRLLSVNYPSLKILSISLFGSSLYSKNNGDYDFLAIVEGNHFFLQETAISLKYKSKLHKYNISISVKGLDNLSKYKFSKKLHPKKQKAILNRTTVSLYKRHLPLIGYDFLENKELFFKNIYPQVSDLICNAHDRYYLNERKIDISEEKRASKILSRLYEAVSYANLVDTNKKMSTFRKRVYLAKINKTSFTRSKKLFDRFCVMMEKR